MAASNSQFAHDWVDEKVLNFLEFLQRPLRQAAAECQCEQMEVLANQLQLAASAFMLADGPQKTQQKLALFSYAQMVQGMVAGEDQSEDVERLSPEKLQLGFRPKMLDVHAEHLQPLCEAAAHVLHNMDYGKLARYLTFLGDQAFHTAKCTDLSDEAMKEARAQLKDLNGAADDHGDEASVPSN